MDKRSWVLVLFLPVFNSMLFITVLPISGVWNPIPTTASKILGNPLFWVGKRVQVEGYLYPPYTDECPFCLQLYRDISPFTCALVDENDKMIGLLLPYQRKVSWWDYFGRLVLPEIVTGVVMITPSWKGLAVCIAVEEVRFARPDMMGQTPKVNK
ncbi:MAG: hypothetical protein JSV05_05080 [Candidatus Bathyarchaeota archaeon]|nr:MAG: hypothetical protein JSV05_05080 [Candidatus Bathyarchaeota archaeon]